MDAVSEVLVQRSRELGGLERMVGASVLAHVALVAVVALAPWWLGTETAADDTPVMTISLGGPPGPRDGGMTAMGGRPIQTVPTEMKKAIEPVRPPAAKAPEMIEPLKNAPKKSEAKVQQTPKDAKSRTPTKGPEVRPGSAIAETGGRGQGFGLSQGGFGAGSYLDVANFCCPEYLATMTNLIDRNWESRQQAAGTTVMKFTIQRNGQLANIEIERSSGYAALDLMARRALILTGKLPPLPAAFTETSLTVHLFFEYQR